MIQTNGVFGAQHAGLKSKSSMAYSRLLADSRPSELHRHPLGHHPPGSNLNGPSTTQKHNQVDASSADAYFDDERMARRSSVVVHGPPRTHQTKKLP